MLTEAMKQERRAAQKLERRIRKGGPVLTGERAKLLRKGVTNVRGIEQAYIYHDDYHRRRIEALAPSSE